MDGSQQDRAYLSSAWDEPPMPTKGHSRRDSISGVADPTLMGQPEAGHTHHQLYI